MTSNTTTTAAITTTRHIVLERLVAAAEGSAAALCVERATECATAWGAETAAEVLRRAGDWDWLAGSSEDVVDVAVEWEDTGLHPSVAAAYMEAGVFTADAARALDTAGVSPERAADRHPELHMTWGYAVANGDVLATDVP